MKKIRKIVVASGKGGTGKTTVALNLAQYLACYAEERVNLLDCDVEAPNDNLFLKANFTESSKVCVNRPVWVKERCVGCGKCVAVCNYNAIAKVKDKILVFDELCHSCGACIHLCPQGALQNNSLAIGQIELAKDRQPFSFGHGILNIGESLAPMVIAQLKQHLDANAINILDAAPGTTCPVVKSMEDMDYCLLVTEPTPFGLNDLRLAATLAAKLQLPTGIVINRSYGDDDIIESFAKKARIPILAKIPFDKEYARSYSEGTFLIDQHSELRQIFAQIDRNIELKQMVPLLQEEIDSDVVGTQFFDEELSKTVAYKEIAVISGKGGTGKTTISGALAHLMDHKILADNDVDASNLYLLCRPEVISSEAFVGGKVYFIDHERCNSCGLCQQHCQFDAIKSDPQIVIDEISCEGCGFCAHLCPQGAILAKDSLSGKWYISRTDQGYLSHAKLGIGQENSGKLVSLVRDHAAKLAQFDNAQLILNDGPPGTGCPVISSITGVDLVVVVAEPTLSGLHDMKRALDLTKYFGIKSFVVVNKWDLNPELTEQIEKSADDYKANILGKIPFDKSIHDALIAGKSIMAHGRGLAYQAILELWENLKEKIV